MPVARGGAQAKIHTDTMHTHTGTHTDAHTQTHKHTDTLTIALQAQTHRHFKVSHNHRHKRNSKNHAAVREDLQTPLHKPEVMHLKAATGERSPRCVSVHGKRRRESKHSLFMPAIHSAPRPGLGQQGQRRGGNARQVAIALGRVGACRGHNVPHAPRTHRPRHLNRQEGGRQGRRARQGGGAAGRGARESAQPFLPHKLSPALNRCLTGSAPQGLLQTRPCTCRSQGRRSGPPRWAPCQCCGGRGGARACGAAAHRRLLPLGRCHAHLR